MTEVQVLDARRDAAYLRQLPAPLADINLQYGLYPSR